MEEKRHCKQCNAEFIAHISPSTRDNQYEFCSRRCFFDSIRVPKLKTECGYCGIDVWYKPYHPRKYCSVSCGNNSRRGSVPWNKSTSKEHSLEKRVRSIKKMAEWRKKILKRDGGLCKRCGDNADHVHHVYFLSNLLDKLNVVELIDVYNASKLWDTKNGMCLCSKCHVGLHKLLPTSNEIRESGSGYTAFNHILRQATLAYTHNTQNL